MNNKTPKTKKRVRSEKLILEKIAVLLISVCLMVSTVVFCFPLKIQAAEITFTNAATVEEDIENLLQDSFGLMSSKVVFITNGVPIAKKFLETDLSGNIAQPFVSKPLIQNIIDEQLMQMSSSNFNAYTRLALKSYGISYNISYATTNGVISSFKITFDITFVWHDGDNALSKRNAVVNHANAFLNSQEYLSKTTTYAKMKAINNYICKTFQYDYRLFVPAEMNNTIYTAYKMISDTGGIGGYPRGVCQAYAMYGYIMLKMAGFDAITIDGHAPIPPSNQPDSNPHAWNMVKIGSYWYHIDLTWDDPVNSGNPQPYYTRQTGVGTVSENYLLRSDSESTDPKKAGIGVNHKWDKIQNGFSYPIAIKNYDGTPDIVNVTQPPAPTVKPTAVPTKIVKPTPTIKPTITISSKSSSINSQSSSKTSSVSSTTSEEKITINPNSKISATPKITQTSEEDSIKTVDIKGQLVDENNNPLSGLKLELYNSSKIFLTDKNGKYSFDDIKAGNYELFLSDLNGKQIAQLPIVITYGESTELNSETIVIKSASLKMNLILKGKELRIGSISESLFNFDDETLLKILIVGAVIILLIIVITVKNKKRNNY